MSTDPRRRATDSPRFRGWGTLLIILAASAVLAACLLAAVVAVVHK